MSMRSELLAQRIEMGAEALAAVAKELTEAEWNTPVTTSDARSVGVIVHHVASVYPVEIHLAKEIAAGRAVGDVTWGAVAEMNAGHAKQNAGAGRQDAIALLLTNARAAAQAVRAMTDEDLDRAAPFSLSYGAPMTAQFVIEDHALRHSWHHLAKIQAAVGRPALTLA